MKTIYFLLLSSFLFLIISCSDPLSSNDLIQDKIQYSGSWVIYLTGDLTGAATIPVQNSGGIHNGVPINFGVANVITYIKGQVASNGTLRAEFYNSFVKDSIKIISDGSFKGTFNDSTCNGSYNLMTNDTLNYSGTWQGIRLE